jgi:hypothetical protein
MFWHKRLKKKCDMTCPSPIPLSQVLAEEFELMEPGPLPPPPKLVDGEPIPVEKHTAVELLDDIDGDEPIEAKRLKKHYEHVHSSKGLNALCLSGGGIRSASFALGVIQGLAKLKTLSEFHYISTVSGGGYAGAWLTAWIHRHRRGFHGVCYQLETNSPSKKNSGLSEPETVIHLREYSNYLSPKLGLFSLDTWTLLATYLRNLSLNWLVFLPLMIGILLLPHLLVSMLWIPYEPYKWLINNSKNVTIYLSVISIVLAVLSLPSLDQRASGPESSKRRVRPGNYMVWLGIIAPMVISSFLWSLRRVWMPNPFRHNQMVGLIWTSVGLYTFMGLAVWFCARYVLKKVNPPRPWTTVLAFFILGWFVGGSVLLLRSLWDFKSHPGASIICFWIPLQMSIFLCLITIYVGITSRNMDPSADDDREWWGRLMGAIMLLGVVWMFVTTVSLLGPAAVQFIYDRSYLLVSLSTLSTVGGIVGFLGGHSVSSGETQEKGISYKSRLLKSIPHVGSAFFIVSILLVLAAGIQRALPATVSATAHVLSYVSGAKDVPARVMTLEPVVRDNWTLYFPKPVRNQNRRAFIALWVLAMSMFVVGKILGGVMNMNRLSLHAIYRSRLIRAFLGASNPNRVADVFTGFDPNDNLPMHHLRRTQNFLESDLFEDVLSPNDGFARIRKFVEFLKDNRFSLGQYMRSKVNQDAEGRMLFDLDSTESSRENWRDYKKLVLRLLNQFVSDPDLAANSDYASWVKQRSADRQEEPVDRVRREIYRAAHQFDEDVRPHLLNRLIMEADCVHEGEHFLRRTKRREGPLLIVNMALNLVNGKNLAWQQRKAASFTVSPLHSGFTLPVEADPYDESGNLAGGYRPSVEYGGGITLGTAIAISGAAASPNMGYHSSPAVTFLLTFLNARLGWWLGNPAEGRRITLRHRLRRAFQAATKPDEHEPARDPDTWRLPSPRHPLARLINEATGHTSANSDYVYLSDGGHFENIGLYEMVRRRCRYIVISDASCDPRFSLDDLGNSIRKIRTDLGIPIYIDDVRFETKSNSSNATSYCAIGKIEYRAKDGDSAPFGTLVYIKASLGTNLPVDVYNYSKSNDEFPHEPTSDQWFSESQFESYRRLGEETIEVICKRRRPCRSWNEKYDETQVPREPVPITEFLKYAREHVEAYMGGN